MSLGKPCLIELQCVSARSPKPFARKSSRILGGSSEVPRTTVDLHNFSCAAPGLPHIVCLLYVIFFSLREGRIGGKPAELASFLGRRT